MNRERARELLPIIQAFIEGKTIQYKSGPTTWEDVTNKMYPSIIESEYRIKPEPREFVLYENGTWVELNEDSWVKTTDIRATEVLMGYPEPTTNKPHRRAKS